MDNEIRRWFYPEWVLYTENEELMQRITAWNKCKQHGTYEFQGKIIAWDIILPGSLFNRVAVASGLPEKKNMLC